ncbi:MAG: Transcriptional repressor sdpR [Ilumatobacteraceae bacterium]|nr:Transcriptional repressor sdpR [Ilumatobacteraceae bacterium]
MILDRLLDGECAVGDLVDGMAMSQPAISKHLKVLRDHGLVSARVDGSRRIYALQPEALRAIDEWLTPYRRRWAQSLDALQRHLDSTPDD